MGFIYKVTFYYFCQQLVGAFTEYFQHYELYECQHQWQPEQQQQRIQREWRVSLILIHQVTTL